MSDDTTLLHSITDALTAMQLQFKKVCEVDNAQNEALVLLKDLVDMLGKQNKELLARVEDLEATNARLVGVL